MKQTFMQMVKDYQKSKDCTRTEALSVIAMENPDLHEAFIQENNKLEGTTGNSHEEKPKHTFMEIVDDYQKIEGCTRTEALKAIAKKWPGLHAAYIEGK